MEEIFSGVLALLLLTGLDLLQRHPAEFGRVLAAESNDDLQPLITTVEEWRLFAGPWTFVVDGEGIIRGKFEGLVTARELEQTLQLNAKRSQ